MRIDPHFLDCVAFVCSRTVASRDRSIAGGTAFFVEVEDESDLHLKWTYVVTALHCIDEIRAQNIYIRVNTLPDVQSNVGFENIPTCKDEWFRHDKADVAAILLDHNPERHVVQGLSLDLFIDREYRFNVQHLDGRGNPQLEPVLKANFPDGIPVQAGDDLFFPGLFVQSAGKKRNLPAARFRNIARMPSDELVVLRTVAHGDTPIRAYLAESHSWGGHSGSPVFWHYTYNLTAPVQGYVLDWFDARWGRMGFNSERQAVMVGRGFATGLLGLVSGHFDIAGEVIKSPSNTRLKFAAKLNSGMAIVTPAENIRELLMREDVIEDRRARAAKHQEPAATADFASVGDNEQLTLAPNPKDRIKIPILTRDQFARALKKATRKRK